jgi:hypothetical protein
MTQRPGGYDPDTEDYPDSGDRSAGWIWALVAIAVVAVGAVLWFGLRSDEPETDSSASPTPSPSTSSSSATEATTSSPATESETSDSGTPSPGDFSTDPVTEGGFPEPGDSIGYGTAVRVGTHDGYDRVVFEFSGSGTPSYQVQYTDSPVAQGSGDPVQVAGDAYLEVTITTVEVPSGSTPSMTTPDTAGTVFAQVEGIWGGFEGYGQTFVGIDGGERPFHVQVLQDPMRLVVDVDTT